MDNYLLTIAIPTYNRSKFLKRNLNYLYNQHQDFSDKVELIVSDNASTDDTESIVKDFVARGLNIRYIKNTENKGAEHNIGQCYIEAKGKYVVALGDDDVFLVGSIEKIIELLTKDEYGVIFLNYRSVDKQISTNVHKLKFIEFNNSINFIKKVNYNITFISGNIVNKKYFYKETFFKYIGTSLPQVSFILNAIIEAPKNIFVCSILLANEPDNTGGYNLFNVFGTNFNQIIGELKSPQAPLIKKIINNKLLTQFFPAYIIKLKNQDHNFTVANPLLYLKPLFKNHIAFWIFCYPLCILPIKMALIYSYLLRGVLKIKSIILYNPIL